MAVVDALVIVGALVSTYVIVISEPDAVHAGGLVVDHSVVAGVLGLIWFAALSVWETRARPVLGDGHEEYRRVVAASLASFGAVAILSFVLGAHTSRHFFLVAMPLGTVALLVERWLLRSALNRLRGANPGVALTPTLLVGAAAEVQRLHRVLVHHPNAGYRPAAAVVTEGRLPHGVADVLPQLSARCLEERACTQDFGAVVIGHGVSPQDARKIAWTLEDAPVQLLVVPQVTDVAGPRLSISEAQGLDLLHVDLPSFSGWRFAVKRVFDLVVAVLALVVTSPVFLLVALAIKLDDGGPILFRQERIGVGGKPFVIHKYRTMRTDAEAHLAALVAKSGGRSLLFKLRDDPRVTRVGKFLRRTSLDELPQFWTVFKGGMSVVGPRPQVAAEVAEYARDTHRRLLVKPGITGLWQINGRSKLSPEESIRLDLRYVENWSLIGDVLIIIKTIKVVLWPDGSAY